MFWKVTFLFSLCLFNCFAVEIKTSNCKDTDPKDYCKINKVDIEPCKEASSNKPCNLRKSKEYSLKIDYTALKPIETLKASAFWASFSGDLPFVGMNETACAFTQCPAEENTEQTYDFKLKIAKSLPRGQFDVKWKFWIDANKDQGCCTKFRLRLI